uniref:Uncharacterized protein n=1 Tax=Rhizophora mucronata TaxID=61149 RepID=A0A2P2J156_RHIMU
MQLFLVSFVVYFMLNMCTISSFFYLCWIVKCLSLAGLRTH